MSDKLTKYTAITEIKINPDKGTVYSLIPYNINSSFRPGLSSTLQENRIISIIKNSTESIASEENTVIFSDDLL
jgi:hypothetical protein